MKYYDQYLQSIIGATIDDAGEKDDQEFGSVPFLLLTKKDGQKTVAWIMQDPEGNGPGHIELDDVEFHS